MPSAVSFGINLSTGLFMFCAVGRDHVPQWTGLKIVNRSCGMTCPLWMITLAWPKLSCFMRSGSLSQTAGTAGNLKWNETVSTARLIWESCMFSPLTFDRLTPQKLWLVKNDQSVIYLGCWHPVGNTKWFSIFWRGCLWWEEALSLGEKNPVILSFSSFIG